MLTTFLPSLAYRHLSLRCRDCIVSTGHGFFVTSVYFCDHLCYRRSSFDEWRELHLSVGVKINIQNEVRNYTGLIKWQQWVFLQGLWTLPVLLAEFIVPAMTALLLSGP